MSKFKLLPEAVAVTNADEARAALRALAGARTIAFDTESTGLVRPKDRAVLLSLSTGEDRYAVWPQVLHYFKDLLENPEVKLLAHNANFDQWMLLNVGIDLDRNCAPGRYRVYDTMVMHALVNDHAAHDLKSLSKTYLDIEMVPFRQTFGAQMKTASLEEIFLDAENYDVVLNYSSLDAYATYHLFVALREELQARPIARGPYRNMWEYYLKTELPFTRVLWNMERAGVCLDKEALLAEAPKIEKQMTALTRWFAQQTNSMTINLDSNAALRPLFFDTLGREPLAYTAKTGAPQLDQAALKLWASNGCVHSRRLLRYRGLKKQLGTYITNLLKRVQRDGRIHTSYNQTGARTGRLSSSDPNLQNQPPHIRSAYVPAGGYRILAADYAQLEMRILAHFSGDVTLCEAIISGRDVHCATAAAIFGGEYEEYAAAKALDELPVGHPEKREFTPWEKELLKRRKAAKTINFGIMYGQGAGALAASLRCSLDEARDVISRYFKGMPGVTSYFDDALNTARVKGYCSTILGRQRLVGDILSPVRADRAGAERRVRNSPIQGTAADITKCGMLKIYESPVYQTSGARMLLQVHDELVFEVPEHLEHDQAFNGMVVDLMTHPFDFDLAVPLEVSMKYGDNWLEAK